MSVEYYLACHECRKRIHVAQMGFSGWTLYSGEHDCMRKLAEWLLEHTLNLPDHRFALHSEYTMLSERYPEIEWTPNHLMKPADGS